MTTDTRRRTITRWNLDGLPWRTWTVREMTWVLYEQLVGDLIEADQMDLLREFLTAAGDRSRIGALDRETMGQTGGVVPEPTPKLRGHHG